MKEKWLGNLNLLFDYCDNKTRLLKNSHFGPLLVQKPFYPEGNEVCQNIIIHPPGGMAGNDTIDIKINCKSYSKSQILTNGATKWYNSFKKKSIQNVEIHVDENACCEWLPNENIFFNGSMPVISLKVNLKQNSSFCSLDMNCLGRSVGGYDFINGQIFQETIIKYGEKEIFYEPVFFKGNEKSISYDSVLSGFTNYGTILIFSDKKINSKYLKLISELESENILSGFSFIDNLFIGRCVGNNAEKCIIWLRKIWSLLRPWYLGRDAFYPRSWET